MIFSGRMAVWLVVPLFTTVYAQLPHTFQWKWHDTSVPQTLEECQTLSIAIEPVDSSNPSATLGIPPYYMLAFKPNGVPTTSAIGSDLTQLRWQVDHVQGSRLMLAIVDSAGSTGGVSQALYNITAGSDTSCFSSLSPSSAAVIQASVSDSLSTCQPWGLTISGGQQPYTVVLSELRSATLTVVTMDDNDDLFTYTNRADPGGQMMASVCDAAGQWGTSTSLVESTGSADITCPGLESSESSSTGGSSDQSFAPPTMPFPTGPSVFPSTPSTAASSSLTHFTNAPSSSSTAISRLVASSKRNAELAICISVGLGVPFTVVILVVVWLYTRKRKEALQSQLDMLASPVKTNRYSNRHSMRDVIAATTFDLKLYLLGHSRSHSEIADEAGPDSSIASLMDAAAEETSARRHSNSFNSWDRLEPALAAPSPTLGLYQIASPPTATPGSFEAAGTSQEGTSADFTSGHDQYSTILIDVPASRSSSPAAQERSCRVAQVYLRPSSSRGSLSQLTYENIL